MIKETFRDVIVRHLGLGAGSFAIRLIFTVTAIFFVFSVLRITSSIYFINGETNYINQAMAIQEPKMMLHVASQCVESIYSEESMRQCQQGVHGDLLNQQAKKKAILYFKGVLLFLFGCLICVGYIIGSRKLMALSNDYEDQKNRAKDE